MRLENEIHDLLDEIGLREIAVRSPPSDDGEGASEGPYRVTCAAPLEDGKISPSVHVEKLTWLSLPGGTEVRIRELNVEERTGDLLRIAMVLTSGGAGPRA